MKTYLCQRCASTIVVGHPRDLFRRRARLLARGTYPLFARLLRRERILGKLCCAIEDKFYSAPHRYRSLPRACPHCGLASEGGGTWWRAETVYAD